MIVLKRSTESFESPTSSAPASMKASSAVDGAAARNPDREWAMSPLIARSLCACLAVWWGGVGVGEGRGVLRV